MHMFPAPKPKIKYLVHIILHDIVAKKTHFSRRIENNNENYLVENSY